MIKRLTKTAIGKSIIAPVIALVIKLLSLSIKWKILNEENKLKALESNEPIIVVFWHERIAVMSKIWPMEKPLAMLQSPILMVN